MQSIISNRYNVVITEPIIIKPLWWHKPLYFHDLHPVSLQLAYWQRLMPCLQK